MRVSVYIDGFNLYYGSLKDQPHRWLNLYEFSKKLLSKEDYNPKVKYFSAPLVSRNDKRKAQDAHKRLRQQLYFRALATIPDIEIILGFFLTHEVFMHRVDDGEIVKVWKSEEKGTDVNIASHLIDDAYQNLFDIAIVVSNDSDLVEPIKMVKKLGKKVVIVSPFKKNAVELKKIASEIRPIRRWMIEQSQFPENMEDKDGEFTKPKEW